MDHSVSGAATKDGVIAAAQLIADSEAKASERLHREIDWLQLNNDMLTDNPVGHARAVAERQAIIAERDQLRAEVEELKAAGGPPFIRSKAIQNLREEVARLKDLLLQAEAELAAERARLDYLQEWGFDFLTRAAIDAAMKEETK
jgi:hypothetical protein